MTTWRPKNFIAGDQVQNPDKLKWGTGTVIDALFLGDLRFKDGPTITFDKNTMGQRLSVKWTDGRTRTLLTPITILKKLDT